ncbi:preprotein translocase subunit YajC [Pseudonocardia nigra]|uniref:preprotein translocase subunit YajC n=1 Tax=Pseudonocardia nigra TaxID=1921578 RepID=UPI001C5E2FB8|nr:preprotein translocase subunit YajC [Pseudonocardia nigra]
MDISLLFPLLILLLFIPIFLSGRRQRRQMKDMQAMQSSLDAGDVVMTTSGLRATVVDASYEETVDLEIADGVVTTWVRAAVREKVNPTAGDAEPTTTATADDVATGASTTTGSSTTTGATTDDADRPSLTKDDSANGSSRN